MEWMIIWVLAQIFRICSWHVSSQPRIVITWFSSPHVTDFLNVLLFSRIFLMQLYIWYFFCLYFWWGVNMIKTGISKHWLIQEFFFRSFYTTFAVKGNSKEWEDLFHSIWISPSVIGWCFSRIIFQKILVLLSLG